jgi:hypothetical protein
MITIGIYIFHNEFGYANPQAISPNGNEITFRLDKISSKLKKKIAGKTEIVQLTIAEMEEILKAKTKIEKVSNTVINNLFGK